MIDKAQVKFEYKDGLKWERSLLICKPFQQKLKKQKAEGLKARIQYRIWETETQSF